MPWDAFESLLRGWGIPLGGMLLGILLGGGVFGVVAWLARRPGSSVAGTVRITVVPGPAGAAATGPVAGAPPDPGTVAPVQVTSAEGTRTILLRGAGVSPNAPLPRARGFLAVLVASFVAISALELAYFSALYTPYDHLVAYAGGVLFWPAPWPGVYAVTSVTQLVPDYIFPMYLAGMASFAIAGGLLYRRPALPGGRRAWALGLLLLYVGVEVLLDAVFFTVPGQSVRNLAIVVRTVVGGVFLSALVFSTLVLPTPLRLKARFPPDSSALLQFFGTGAIAIAVAAAALALVDRLLGLSAVLLPFTLLLLLPLVTLETFIALNRPLYFRQMGRRLRPSLAEYHPPVSILMPAYNEERWIAEAIRHADVAAGLYPGAVEIIVGNDGSTDRTSEIARSAIAQLRHARGMVVDLPHAGKSNGLNGALALATGEIVIRLDADTFVSERLGFSAIIPHFADPEVGGVQGSIHPRQRTGWTRKLRALEIAWGHYFQRPAIMGVRSGEVIDGLFSAFRRSDLVALGGWVPWNGEDTELSMRVQRLGYRIRLEFGARAYEDVPEDYQALRRQRVRWARGILMANGQHYPALVSRTPEFAGLGVLLWFLTFARSGVRSLVYVFLGLLFVLLGVHALVDVAYLLLLALVLRAVPLGYFLAKMGRWDVLVWIPFFPIASVIKQTFRFEAFGLMGPEANHEYA
ncbi:MAG TPA: glycosyltransferase family 2 protein [Thermoplasmata archaeon]|nr:glycosyltransferase family 2 protein [Thermoplasmata archaeon]